MHTALVNVVHPETNEVIKENVKMKTDGKLTIAAMNVILLAQGSNCIKLVSVLEDDFSLPPLLEV